MIKKITGVVFLTLFLFISGCSQPVVPVQSKILQADSEIKSNVSKSMTPSVLRPEEAYWPTKEWRISTPEQHGVDSEKLLLFAKEAEKYNDSLGFKSYIIVKDGYIIAESYINAKADKPEPLYSITKSIVSAAYGVALKENKVMDVQSKVVDCFKEKEIKNLDKNKKSMTIKNLLTMTTGLDWYEKSDPTREMENAADRVKYILDTPMSAKPGEEYSYNNGAAQVIAEYLEKCVGKSFEQYVAEKIFTPLGIDNYSWRKYPDGCINAYAGISMTARDMAKFGYLFLNNGKWEGIQVIPEEWVEESTGKKTGTGGKGGEYTEGYGYYWWIDSFGSYSARGMFDQEIIINPQKNLVVVFQTNLRGPLEANQMIPLKLTRDYIYPAVIADGPLPQNPGALQELYSLMKTNVNN